MIPLLKIYIILDLQCTATVLPDPFSVSKRSQKWLKIAKSHSFIYLLTISMTTQIFPFLGYNVDIRCIKRKLTQYKDQNNKQKVCFIIKKWIDFKICLIFVKIEADQISFLDDFSNYLIINL